MHKATSLAEFGAYPRVYRASTGWLAAMILGSLISGLGGLTAAWLIAHDQVVNPQSRPWLVVLFLAFAALGGYCLLWMLRFRVVLFADRIEVEGPTSTVILHRSEIQGWRCLPTSPPQLILLRRNAGKRPVKVAQMFPLDPEFVEWLSTIPNLDGADARNSRAEIRNNTRLGSTPGERMKVLGRGQRLAKILTVVSCVAIGWGLLYPRPYQLLVGILAILPWAGVGIVSQSRGLFRIDGSRRDAHPNVAIAFITPGMILMLRATLDYNVIASWTLASLTAATGGLLAWAAVAVDPAVRRTTANLVAIIMLCLCYGYGVTIEANVLLDRSPASTYRATVEGKQMIKAKSTTWELNLAPWGPAQKPTKLRISRATYDRIGTGDVVSLELKQGVFGLNWYRMRDWEHGTK